MKKVIVALSMLLTSFSATADDSYTIVNAGSDSGDFKAVLSMIGNQVDSKFIQANNPVVAASHFNNKNVLTMWSTEWPGDSSMPSVEMNENTIIGIMTYETIMCSRTFTSMSDMSGKTIKIATWGKSPPVKKFLDRVGKDNNINFVIVPYDGSGATTRGYLGNDTDTIFTTQTKQAKVEADGKCFAFSANGDLDFAFVDVIVSINASKTAVNNARSVVAKLVQSEAWETAFGGTMTYIINSGAITSKVNSAISNFSN